MSKKQPILLRWIKFYSRATVMGWCARLSFTSIIHEGILMVDRILLYISAAADLEIERSVLSRAITEIPVTLGWRIIQSPIRGEAADLESVSKADIHLLLMGSDIRAPVGLEWYFARRVGRSPLPFLKKGILRTPAAQEFIRTVEEQHSWSTFKDPSDLRHQTLLLLGEHIHRHAIHYALKPKELERLEDWLGELRQASIEKVEESKGGTGESSIILSPERYVPSEGVLIQPRHEDDET